MVTKLNDTNPGLNIPQHAGHITGASNNLPIIDESAATKVTGMGTEFACAFDICALLGIEVVNGANIVKPTTRDKVA